MMLPQQELGGKLKTFRKKQTLTQRELAQKLKMTTDVRSAAAAPARRWDDIQTRQREDSSGHRIRGVTAASLLPACKKLLTLRLSRLHSCLCLSTREYLPVSPLRCLTIYMGESLIFYEH